MTTYYKATAPDGLSFASGPTGRIDYGAALVSGEVIRHPSPKKVRGDAGTYLSVSVEPADCTGFSWPCRLFRVEPVGRVSKSGDYPHKRCASALRVVEELPAWQALGPNGEQVAALLASLATLTTDDILRLGAARGAARGAAWGAARGAAWDAAWDAACDAARGAAWGAARGAARDAACALLARDLVTTEQFDTLTGPWVSVMGATWEAAS